MSREKSLSSQTFASPINRGYFGIGVESISKSGNLGNLVRSSHAFGASFFFTVDAVVKKAQMEGVDTSSSALHMPFYEFANVKSMVLPTDCTLVGIELTDDAVDLPSFRHPTKAVYILGPEKGNLSPAMIERCAFCIKIPMKFCINVGVAGAIVMYDRMISLGNYAERPVRAGGPQR